LFYDIASARVLQVTPNDVRTFEISA
jgi:hypothetical protein